MIKTILDINEKTGFIPTLTSVVIISIVVVSVVSFTIYYARLIGPILILLGFVPWIPLKISVENKIG